MMFYLFTYGVQNFVLNHLSLVCVSYLIMLGNVALYG